MGDTGTFEYNEANQIELMRYPGLLFEVSFMMDNVIEIDLLEENVSNLEIETNKKIFLSNNVVQNIVTSIVEVGLGFTGYSKDSISYTYVNNYPSKIEYYSKASTTTPIPTDYVLYRQKDFTVSNGNIIKAVTTEGEVIKEGNYTYDNEAHIKFGEISYEMPLGLDVESILIHDKFGTPNTNNIISLTNDFEAPFELGPEYKTINYTRTVNSNNRLTEISISGESIAELPAFPSSTLFNNKVGIFTY